MDENTPLKVKTGDLSVGTLITIACGFGVDAFDIFVMNIVLLLFKEIYGAPQTLYKELVVNAVLVGAMIGQVLFGQLGDIIGRKKMLMVTLSIIVTFSALSAAAQDITGPASLYIWLTISRFFCGVGIGGEYPLSATVTSELSTTETRGRNMAIVFSSQGVGNLVASGFCTLLAYADVPLEWVWRSAFLFPAVICLLSAYPRSRLGESTRFLVHQNASQANQQDTSTFKERTLKTLQKISKHKLTLLGTAGSWFLFDITFYGNSLFNSSVMQILNFQNPNIKQTILFSLILSAIGLPGYIFSVLFAERIGRKIIQMMGFGMMGIIFAIMTFFFEALCTKVPVLFIILYGLTFFFSNFGPNATTYSIPAEVFPVEIAATCHGISAALGKAGAFVGTALFPVIQGDFGTQYVFGACSVISFLGLLLTFLVTQDTRKIDLLQVDNQQRLQLQSQED